MQDEILLNERTRLKELYSYQILDTPSEKAYDDIIELASDICGTPIALVTLIDSDRQWFKSKIGIEVEELPRASALCSHAILEPDEIFLVENAQTDKRFSANPMVTGDPHKLSEKQKFHCSSWRGKSWRSWSYGARAGKRRKSERGKKKSKRLCANPKSVSRRL